MKPCIEWMGARTKKGHGHKKVNGKTVYIHRLTWEQEHGPIPPGMQVLHSCDNPPCYLGEHLHLGTPADNRREWQERGARPYTDNRPTKEQRYVEKMRRITLCMSRIEPD